MTTNKEKFVIVLTDQYRQLFELPEYAIAASRFTLEEMSIKFTDGLISGISSNEGIGVKRACKVLGIKSTYKSIKEFLV